MELNTDELDVGNKVCVVGSGALGLVAMKNLMEQGLEVQAFEKNEYVGGIWHVSLDPSQTSALSGTRAQFSKQVSSFTDFPMPNDYPTYPSAKDYQKYLESYARHFDITQCIQFSTLVTNVRRDVNDNAWLVFTRNTRTNWEEIKRFGRVIFAIGTNRIKHQPKLEGIEKFTGDIIHSQELKDLNKYSGKRVLVVGSGPTGADTLQFLEEIGAMKLYLSHRSEFTVVPRMIRGRPHDHYITRRMMSLFRSLISFSPRFACALISRATRSAQKAVFPFLASHMSLARPWSSGRGVCFPTGLVVSDHLPYQLRDGIVEAVPEIHKVIGPCSVACGDKTITNLDAIIFCTGYRHDYSIIDGAGNPADPAFASDRFERFNNAQFRKANEHYPRLYYGLLSERYPSSLAILGFILTAYGSVFVQYDLATMALASLWSGSYPLPSKETMKEEIDAHYEFVVKSLERGPMPYTGFRVNDKAAYEWMNLVAGTGIHQRLETWGWAGWRFWWRNRDLYQLLVNGINAPAVYRLFDSGRGRRPWKDAMNSIERTQQEVKAIKEAWKDNIPAHGVVTDS